MSTTLTEARDDIQGAFTLQWNADTPAVTPAGTVPPIFYDGLPDPAEQPVDEPWAHIIVRHNTGNVRGIGGFAPSRRRTTKTGLVTVQIFTPLKADNVGAGTELSENLADIAKDAFEGHTTTNCVIFRDVVPQEVGPDGPWYQVNVLANFEYDEFV